MLRVVHLIRGAEHKGATLATVVMDIDKGQYALRIVSFAVPNQLFHCCDLRLKDVFHVVVPALCFIVLKVEPVEVFADKACAVVACHHTIGVRHWYNLEDHVVPQMACILRDEVVDDAMEDPG